MLCVIPFLDPHSLVGNSNLTMCPFLGVHSKATELLKQKGYDSSSIETVLAPYQEMIVRPEYGIENVDDAINALRNKYEDRYNRMNKTRKFMLKYFRGSGINLEFATKIGGLEAKTKIKSWPKFVSIDVVCDKQYSSNKYDYSMNIGGFFIFGMFPNGNYDHSLKYCLIPVLGQIGLLVDIIQKSIDPFGFYTSISHPYSTKNVKKDVKEAIIANDKRKIIYEHIAQLKDETEQALINIANEKALASKQPEYLLEGQTNSSGPK